MNERKELLPYAGLVTAMLFWAVSYVWVKEAYDSFTPITLVFFRLLLSTILLLVIGKLLKRLNPIKKGTVKNLMLLAFFEPLLYYIGESYGISMVSPTTGSIIIATTPLFVALSSFLFFKERLPFLSFIGALISFSGVLLMIISNGDNLKGQALGILLMFLAVSSVVGYTLILNKISTQYTPFSLITYQNAFGAIFFAPIFFINDYQSFSFTAVTAESWQKLFLLAFFCSSIAYILFVDGIRHIGVSKANYFINLIPVFTATFAIHKGLDTLNVYMVAGIALTVGGLFLSQFKGSFFRRTLKKVLKRKKPLTS
ncbi:drug/metabolite transporter (DMT)-like permease [Balneicella halophila]|uniref:Drug/metabolite transporter (DMT)-like permease n=1 Tax=Balneicella halophila TaxID=1537566 RepID=A0A7L4UMX7_BALHA|nr:DMT family transporter [Balneicella halophila]PVX49892.1 drug/metabolite transporter (DMT)-like permease [Balneicella halophila]